MLFPIKVDREAPRLLIMARQIELLPGTSKILMHPWKLKLMEPFIWFNTAIVDFFQVAKRREKLLNYMLFLRVTPTLPNTFINVASPIVDVPYHIFLLATSIGLIPAAYVTVRVRRKTYLNLVVSNNLSHLSFWFCFQAGLALGELRSLADLYDIQAVSTLFFIGIVSMTPTLMSKTDSSP